MAQQINEVMSFAGFMDVKELKALYYGRMDMFVSFTDDWNFITSGDGSRPDGILAHAIDTVVGRKVGTHLFYGRVFRSRVSGRSFLSDIKHYSGSRYTEDKELLSTVGFYKEEDIQNAISVVEADSRIRTDFERIWNITRILSESKGSQMANKYWRETFIELGYDGFNDPTGTGIIADRGIPVMLLLNYDRKEDVDIVHVQKYRVDKRKMTTDKIERENKKMKPRRDRIAKMKKEDFHKGSGITGTIRRLLGV